MMSAGKKQNGFILVAVLWLLVIMVLSATAFSVWVERLRTQVMRDNQKAEANLQTANVLAVFVYTYATGMKLPEGVPLPLEGKPEIKYLNDDDAMSGAPPIIVNAEGYLSLNRDVYEIGDTRIMLHDRKGLIGLSRTLDQTIYDRIAALSMISSGAPILQSVTGSHLAATLADFRDADSIRQAQGAESLDYTRANKALPNNAPLVTPLQLRQVMGWDEALKDRDDAWLLQTFKESGGRDINVNTAASGVLGLLVGNQENLEKFLKTRAAGTIRSAYQPAFSTDNDDGSFITILPAEGFRMWCWVKGDTIAWVYDVQFLPNVPGSGAWFINWSLRVNLPDELAQRKAQTINHSLFKLPAFTGQR